MSSQRPIPDQTDPINAGDADFAQAFKDLARGEKTASALERQLSAMEKKIDELLAQAEKDQEELDRKAAASRSKDADGATGNQSNVN